jgi:hypothetical protein
MCEPVTLATIGSTVASAAGAAIASAPTWLPIATAGINMAGQAADMRSEAKALNQNAAAETANAAERAARLRAQGLKVMAEQRLQQLSSGLEGGTGSALEIAKADAAELELDVLTEIYGGEQRALAQRKQAKRLKAGSNLMAAGAGGAAAVLGGTPIWGAFAGGGGNGASSALGSVGKAFAKMGAP